jgi:hypothetical protein
LNLNPANFWFALYHAVCLLHRTGPGQARPGQPAAEVAALMHLLAEFVAADCEELVANGVRLLVTGDASRLPPLACAGDAILYSGR